MAGSSYLVREAAADDVPAMADVEKRADAALVAVGVALDDLEAPAAVDGGRWTRAYVAVCDGVVVGMARLSEIAPGLLCLDQLSVVPEHARTGIGRMLLERVVGDARAAGYHRLTGTTFRDVAFNAPFYASLGAVEDADPHPEMLARRRVERAVGLDRFGERIVMRLDL